ncbi:hypothetical protein ACOJQI_06310 [Bacillus salacetis]|uniref:hypothetical protein n=1 Tax=Bacillus salacetis TaxID=2315464 RepID=UPI003B9EE48C
MERKLRQHPFDIMVMGRKESIQEDEPRKGAEKEYSEETENNGDLMSNIEALMGAVSELKPLMNKIMPLITKWTKS